MRIYIRADGGEGIGLGHIMRTLVLAKELSKEHTVKYLCLNKMKYYKGVEVVIKNNIDVIKLDTEEDGFKFEGSIIIVDKYGLNEDYYKTLKKSYKKVVCLDDNNELDFYFSDIVINQNIYAEELIYNCSSNTKLLLGPKYVLLRDEFINLHPININKRVENILITVGGSDDNNITERIINELKNEYYILHVIIGNAFINEESLRRYESDNIIFYKNPEMSEVMKKCDMAISGYGSTIYELCYLGVPTMGVKVADNQKRLAKVLKDRNIASEINFGSIIKQIEYLSYEKRIDISEIMKQIIDGNGKYRIKEVLSRRKI